MVCLFFNITRQVAICLFTRGRRSSLHQVDNQYTCQITTWAAFFVQKWAPPCTRAGVVGKETGVRAPCVHLFSSCTSPTYVGVCERDTNLDIMRRPSPCLRPVRPPVTTTPHSSSPYLSSFIFLMKFLRYHFSDKILEISLVFTHGITPSIFIQGATIKITICRYTRPLTLIDAILMVFASWY